MDYALDVDACPLTQTRVYVDDRLEHRFGLFLKIIQLGKVSVEGQLFEMEPYSYDATLKLCFGRLENGLPCQLQFWDSGQESFLCYRNRSYSIEAALLHQEQEDTYAKLQRLMGQLHEHLRQRPQPPPPLTTYVDNE